MDIRVSQAFLITEHKSRRHRWAIANASDGFTAVCLGEHLDFPDLDTVIEDMDSGTWICHRTELPDYFSILQAGQVKGHVRASPPPLELVALARILDELAGEQMPEGCTTVPIWALAGVNGDTCQEH